MTKYKSKAQMNWEIGKESEVNFLATLYVIHDMNYVELVRELFAQIRQTEYRRGKEDALKEIKK